MKFFIGSSPSLANRVISPDYPAYGVMVSVNSLRKRVSNFSISQTCNKRWIMDSGAFTEISRFGYFRYSPEEYIQQIQRFSHCGNLIAAASQDWMCEPFILDRTGLSVTEHQKLTIDRYKAILKLSNTPIMPVLQGYRIPDYISHIQQYGKLLQPGAWVGVGSVCRRNGKPNEIADLLKSIKLIRPDLKLHGFGLKSLALVNTTVRENLYSSDSMAWSYPRRFAAASDSVQNPLEIDAHEYQVKIDRALKGHRKQPTSTSGAGNGQGRKPKWHHTPTTAIRVPTIFADKLLNLAKSLDKFDY